MDMKSQEDKKLKFYLVLHSFSPLFLLIAIKHAGFNDLKLIYKTLKHIFYLFVNGNEEAVNNIIFQIFTSNRIGNVIVTILCLVWFINTAVISLGFQHLHFGGFDHNAELISIEKVKSDSGLTFLLTCILPLTVDNISTIRGLIYFIVLLVMAIYLDLRSDNFYQNPVLAFHGYITYEFKFINPNFDVEKNKTYIGVTKGSVPSEKSIIKRKYIANDVFLVYNE